MLKIEGLKLAPGESEALLYERAAAALRVKAPLACKHRVRPARKRVKAHHVEHSIRCTFSAAASTRATA